ncbi:MAG: glycosyltransferase [Thermoanaerobaculia bacterium]
MSQMRLLQLVTADAPAFERKLQAIDRRTLEDGHDVMTWTQRDSRIMAGEVEFDSSRVALEIERLGPDVVHVYGPPLLPPGIGRKWRLPWVATGRPVRRRFSLRAPATPTATVAPTGDDAVPEAVASEYLAGARAYEAKMSGRRLIGSIGRGAAITELVEAVFARLARFRDDVDWNVFDAFPSNEEMDQVDVWVDPAIDDADFDGFVAEALVRGRLTVASRTPINMWRLAGGKYGVLARPADPNEMAHAIANALFKPETGEDLLVPPSVHAERFSASGRGEKLLTLYRRVIA